MAPWLLAITSMVYNKVHVHGQSAARAPSYGPPPWTFSKARENCFQNIVNAAY